MSEEIMRHRITRRAVLLAGSGFLLSACSETPLRTMGESLLSAVAGSDDPPIPRSRIDSIPYASMTAKFGRGGRALIILARVDGEDHHWFSASRTVLVTRRGRVIRTAGFPANLKWTRLIDEDPLRPRGNGRGPTSSFRRLVDLGPPDHYGVMITSRLESLGAASIVIAELQFDTQVFVERCAARELDWSFENRYWVDPENGLIWKSIQHVHPDLPPVELELLKPTAV